VAVTETHETAKAHDGVGHASGQFVDDEVIDLTDIPAIGSIDGGSVDVFARNASMVWMSSCACHGLPPCNGLLPFQFDHDGDVPQPITVQHRRTTKILLD
jgi:hypothetical protein